MSAALRAVDGGFDLTLDGRTLLRHRPGAPCVEIGIGEARVAMFRGNFDIADREVERAPLRHAATSGNEVAFARDRDAPTMLTMRVEGGGGDLTLAFEASDAIWNRFRLRVEAEADESVWGCGEQMSHLDLRGRRFPLWTSEPGVGRDKSTEITRRADSEGMAGGDYWTTNYPQPTYLSSRRYALHVEGTAYAAFDFTASDAHALEVWEVPSRVRLWARPRFAELVTALSDFFGRAPAPPDWALKGAIVGLKDGDNSFARLQTHLDAGVVVAGLWCEDWVGLRRTSFGARLFWDWRASEERYPGLRGRIDGLHARGIRFLGYVNPYLCDDGALFGEAQALGFLAKDGVGATYRVDFGEFFAGIVDFTTPAARDWFAERVIGAEMLDVGLDGWMADFGEYLPVDARLARGDAMALHNAWPVLWAEVNAEAIRSRGRAGDATFFMRAGHSGVQRHCPLLWAGDQSVDFSRHDGIGTAVTAALSAGLAGNPFSHSDIGGYTSLYGNVRSFDLLARWIELAAFTPVMRTHEGNRPRDNLQIDEDPRLLALFARMTRLHAALFPYLKALAAEAVALGLPLQRAAFLHFEDDRALYGERESYMLGAELFVAPVLSEGAA
ncbi:MAG: alpha-glucosidase, partial [Hyphomicrobiales bacterium]|nr:alpha-glucosidase [Hyphomicrobiales bacterium]